MATNDFLSFAGDGAANVLTQSDYAALTTILADGFSSGILPSERLNKVLRQSAAISNAVGAMIASSGLNALDDGDAATLLANLKSSISAQTGRLGHSYADNDWAYIDQKNGLKIQWGNGMYSGGSGSFSFPTAFSSACFFVLITSVDSVLGPSPIVSSKSTSGFAIIDSDTTGNSLVYISIGV